MNKTNKKLRTNTTMNNAKNAFLTALNSSFF